jgi:outer membrane immunogenic protein
MRYAWKVILSGSLLSFVGFASAQAADLPPPPAPPPRAPATYVPAPVALYNWTGFYLGGNLGWGQNQGGFNGPGGPITVTNTSSFLGGAQVGYNYQFGGGGSGIVLGAEADFDWLFNSNNTTNATAGGVNVTSNNRWATLLDARLGYAFDRWLVYGKGGWAWIGSGNSCVTGGPAAGCYANNSNYGWNAGAGVEWAFLNNLSARLQYDYVGINSTSIGPYTGSGRSFQMITLGLNYKFGF